MKRILLILFGVLCVSKSYSQNNNFQLEINISEYYVDTLYSQIDFCYSNTSEGALVLWIEKDNVDTLSTQGKIKKHFFTRKGDWSLMGIICDGNVACFTPGLFDSFMKVINPQEQFTVSIIKKGGVDIKLIEKQIVIVHTNEIRGLQIDRSIEMFNYRARGVTFLAEWLNIKG